MEKLCGAGLLSAIQFDETMPIIHEGSAFCSMHASGVLNEMKKRSAIVEQ